MAYVKQITSGSTNYGIKVANALTLTPINAAGTSGDDVTYDGSATASLNVVTGHQDIRYGYASKTGASVTADEAKVNRVETTAGTEYLTAATTIALPVYEDKVAECIIRFGEGATLYAPTITLASGTASRWYISGDVPAAGTNASPNQYEMLCQVVPTATNGTYEVITSTRKLATSES